MYKKIMIPVDLAHADKLDRALDVAADLTKHYAASATLLGVTAPQPSEVAHNPKEYAEKLARFTEQQAAQRGTAFMPLAMTSHDPARDLDETLSIAIRETGADLVIMASHVPSFAEHILASNAGYLAAHTDVSFFIVR